MPQNQYTINYYSKFKQLYVFDDIKCQVDRSTFIAILKCRLAEMNLCNDKDDAIIIFVQIYKFIYNTKYIWINLEPLKQTIKRVLNKELKSLYEKDSSIECKNFFTKLQKDLGFKNHCYHYSKNGLRCRQICKNGHNKCSTHHRLLRDTEHYLNKNTTFCNLVCKLISTYYV